MQPGHAVSLHCRQERIELARGKRPHFLQRACRQHCVKSRFDAAHQFLALTGDENLRCATADR